MKVLTLTINVSDLTDDELESLQYALEVQCEDAGGTDNIAFDAPILTNEVSDV